LYEQPVSLDIREASPWDATALVAGAARLHGLRVSDFAVYDYRAKKCDLNRPQNREQIVYNLFHRRFVAVMLHRRKALALAGRCVSLQRLLGSEDEYHKDVSGFTENVLPFIHEIVELLPELAHADTQPFKQMQDALVSIAKLHTDLWNGGLRRLRGEYLDACGAMLSVPLKMLIVYGPVYDAIRKIVDACLEKRNARNPRLKAIGERFQKTPFAAGRTVEDCFVAVWRRPANLRAMIREILEFTPPSHEDWAPLTVALVETDRALEAMNGSRGDSGAVYRLFPELRACGQDFVRRCAVQEGRVRVDVLVFRSKIAVVGPGDPERRTVASFPMSEVEITQVGRATISFGCGGRFRVLRCKNTEAREALLAIIRVAEAEAGSRLTLSWAKVGGEAALPPRTGHVMFFFHEELYIYGGLDEDRQITGDIFRISVQTYAATKVMYERGPIPRIGFGWTVYREALYIYGGGTDANNLMSDFWCFGPRQQE
jgi:hypothetical protein